MLTKDELLVLDQKMDEMYAWLKKLDGQHIGVEVKAMINAMGPVGALIRQAIGTIVVDESRAMRHE